MGGQRNEARKATDEGILLGKNLVEPRAIRDVQRRIVHLPLREPVFARLVEMARKAGRTTEQQALDLFEAAYAARCAPTGDAALDREVSRSGERGAERAAREAMERAVEEAARIKRSFAAQIEALERAEASARATVTTQREAMAALQTEIDALRAERDPRAAERDAEMRRSEEHARFADQFREALETTKAKQVTVHVSKSGPLSPETEAAIAEMAEQARAMLDATKAAEPAAPIAFDDAQRRLVLAYRAAGLTATEIAQETGLPVKNVKAALDANRAERRRA